MKHLLRAAAVLLLACLLCGAECAGAEGLETGTDIPFGDIREFYYTYDASTDPPFYQRYRLYAEDGKHFLYHETREGGGWPQTEEDITVSGIAELTEEQWTALCETLRGGTARVREVKDGGDGDAGPWMFIYWDGGEAEGREFTFESWEKQGTFEELCFGIREQGADGTESVSVHEKLDKEYYFGLNTVLPDNLNAGENTLRPELLFPQLNTDHNPGVRIVPDTDSPVKELFGFKHEVYKGGQTGWQSVINAFPVITEDMHSFSMGFWVNKAEISDIFSDGGYLDLAFINTSKCKFGIRMYLDDILQGYTEESVFIAGSNDLIETADVSAVLLEETSDYGYIRLDVRNIRYAEELDFSGLVNLKLYWKFDAVASAMAGRKITFVGITFLKNDTIRSGYYRYPDRNELAQLPAAQSVDERIAAASGEDGSGIELIYTEGKTEDVCIRSCANGITIENYMVAMYDDKGYNGTCRPTACYLTIDGVRKPVFKSEDDGCPLNLSSGYIASGHGYIRGIRISAENHGKTCADIGSKWTDEAGVTFCILKIFDGDTIGLLADHPEPDSDYDTLDSLPEGTLTHAEGACNTGAISAYTMKAWQIEPIVMSENHTKKILLDGKKEISVSGKYRGQFVDITEEYDVVNPQSIIEALVKNRPSGGYTENPDPNKGVKFFHISNIYRYLEDGTLLLFSTLDNDVPLQLGYWGATQYAEKNAANVLGGKCRKYLPETLPQTVGGVTYDLRVPYDMADYKVDLYFFRENSWADRDCPPDRCLTFYTDSKDVIRAGYAVGYLPVNLGDPAVRKENVSCAVTLFNSRKFYPRLIDNRTVPGYSALQSVCYRKPLTDIGGVHTSAYFVPYGDECYLYADYHETGEDRIKIPAKYIGKQISVIRKSDGIAAYGTLATNEIRIVCSDASPNAFIVIRIH